MRRITAATLFFAVFLPGSQATAVAPTQAPTNGPNDVFVPGAKQLFKLKFIDTTAGELTLETLPKTTFEGRPAYHFRANVQTVGLIRLFYKFNQSADIYFDREKNQPIYVDVRTTDRKKIGRTQIRMNQGKLQGEELEESVDSPGEPKHERSKHWSITQDSQSLFTILSFIQLQNLAPGKKISFPVAHDEKNALFKAEVTGVEKIHTPDGDKDALVVKVDHESASRFRSSIKDDPLIWLARDQHKTLLKFQFKHRRGLVFAVPSRI